MSYSPSSARLAARCRGLRIVLLLVAMLLPGLGLARGQQPVERRRAPSLNTDDVMRARASQPGAEEKTAPEAEPGAGAAKPDVKTKPGEGKADKGDPEEASWRVNVSKARERAKTLQRQTEEAELRTTELRNDLSRSGGTAQGRNQTAADLDQAGQQLNEIRTEAKAAVKELEQLLEYGRQKQYTEVDNGPKPTTEAGKPNEEFYRTQYAKLITALQDAERQVQLYENRVSDLSQRLLQNGGKKGGDNFYAAQIEEDRQDNQQKLDEARAARSKAQSDIEALMEEARKFGVPPGVFR